MRTRNVRHKARPLFHALSPFSSPTIPSFPTLHQANTVSASHALIFIVDQTWNRIKLSYFSQEHEGVLILLHINYLGVTHKPNIYLFFVMKLFDWPIVKKS